MTPEGVIIHFLVTSIIAGLAGGAAMQLVMFLITRADWAHQNMIVAVGSLFTRRREHAFRTGVIAHVVSAIGFAVLYNLAVIHVGLAHLPAAFFVGAFLGTIHGVFVSLALVWVVCERHPLEEFQGASFAIGLSHLAGHVAYGAAVGFVIGIAGLIH
ncbi:MAG: hypothetical protein ACREFX_08005 [Opitutaceae bacterium]